MSISFVCLLYIDSSGWKNYIHFVYRSNLKTIVDLLQADIIDNYGK